jgi:hypothetical protein
VTPAERAEYRRRYHNWEITPEGHKAQNKNAHIQATPAIREYNREAIKGLREEYSLPTPRPYRLQSDIGYIGKLTPKGF